ncbi:MAG: hypothetical protein L6W00_03500 [Lentisphaeria bacterium]|nr:MAG: hypothetical protein L6W00_03500 [Lentisphaeria bacterium]
MKNLPLFTAVFLLVFLGGLGLVLLLHKPEEKRSRPAAPPPAARKTAGAPRGLPPLELPRGAKRGPARRTAGSTPEKLRRTSSLPAAG